MNLVSPSSPSDLAKSVRDETGGKLRSFLYELAEGVTNYRTVHSLTEQVQHQYHGRFAIELIQNAYDAVARDPISNEGAGRIEMRLVEDRNFGTLYVSNDGLPFSRSNFISVSQLGQSDKSPETSIGNKGIGFRSVLEICDRPQIWSKRTQSSRNFDGYCFNFSPDFVRSLHEPILRLIGRETPSPSDVPLNELVDWNDGLLDKLHSSIHNQANEAGTSIEAWVKSQLSYLSPYLLPWPLVGVDRVQAITEFEELGFSTVVALPLKSSKSAKLVERRLKEIGGNSLLFLDRLQELTLSLPDCKQVFKRTPKSEPDVPRHYSKIKITSREETREFRTWRREIGVADMPEAVRASIQELPGQWPKLTKVEITLAVGACETPAPGQLSIFLPTKLESGASIHVNAPFFGDMSRTLINFGDVSEEPEGDAVYNDYLLSQAADLAVEAIDADLQGKSATEAADIIDLLSPNSTDEPASDRWQAHLCNAAQSRDFQIEESAWLLSDKGWVALNEASLLPLPEEPKVLSAEVLRRHAKFPAYAAELGGRSRSIKALSGAHGIGWLPLPQDQAETVESAAAWLHSSGPVDWKGFWEDVQSIFADDLLPLQERKLLLCTDGQLHAGGISGSAIYFKPRQAGPDEDDGPGDLDIDQIPKSLRQMIAILDPAVPVSELRQGRLHNTNLHGELINADLVGPFRRESVLTQVLIPNLPPLPVTSSGVNADLCRDALYYGIRLAQSMQFRGEGQGINKALAKLPVPCRGGWYRLKTASFGADWPGTTGYVVDRYLKCSKGETVSAARDRMLRSPKHRDWGGQGQTILELLRDAGVHDGLRLEEIAPKSWNAKFHASKHYFQIPEQPPTSINPTAWNKTREAAIQDAQPRYNNGYYEIGDILWIPGLERYEEFDLEARAAFFDVVMASAGGWQDNWAGLSITRVEGSSDYFTIRSPLLQVLGSLDWIGEYNDNESWTWTAASSRWYVPSQHLARGRAWTLEHLSPLPPAMAEQLDRSEGLVTFLGSLGMPTYAPDEASNDPRLLACLADTAKAQAYQNRDVFIGQIRTAWKAFKPFSVEDFPEQIVAHQPDGSLAALTPTSDEPVYLPNPRTTLSTLRHFNLPAVTIEPTDATRLSDDFENAYDAGVLNAAQIHMAPLSAGAKWISEDSVPLTSFSGLDETIPFVLTIAAFHGVNARGTSATSFNRYLDILRSAQVSIVPDLGLVPEVDNRQVAEPRVQKSVWLEAEHRLLLDNEWREDIEPVADAFTQMIEREDLKFQIRKGLSEVWPDLDEVVVSRLLGQMDLSLEHYREVFELWRGDLGPAVERLSRLMWVLSCPEQSAQLQKADQRDLILAPLCAVLDSDMLAERVLQAALEARDVFEFGRSVRDLLGSRVELSAWNAELARSGEAELLNPAAGKEFSGHREAAALHLRRIAATLTADDMDGPTYPELMSHIESVGCPDDAARAFWRVPFSEFFKAIAKEITNLGFSDDLSEVIAAADSPDSLARYLDESDQMAISDPLDVSKANRKLVAAVLDRFRLTATAWHTEAGREQSADWLAGFGNDALAPVLAQDRSIYSVNWTQRTVFELVADNLTEAVPQDLRHGLKNAQSLETLPESLGVSAEQLDGAAAALEKVRQDADRRKRMVKVCGAEFDNSETNISNLFDHIADQIDDESLASLLGFDLHAPMVPKKLNKPKPTTRRDKDKKTRAPKRQCKNMEDLIGAAGEIHAFRWLRRRYGAAVISPSNWVSAYSEKAYPDNSPNVDEGRGCDVLFAHEGCTYFIEIKSTDSESTDFTLGSSEVRLARELVGRRGKKVTKVFHILRVSNALSASPTFTLLPNPYDPRYAEHFAVIDEGARVSYRI
ncbi:ATP-binding protein [Phaeobacter sp. G2]|nr:ATP-binding protein [Phaeobacter sp. G2]